MRQSKAKGIGLKGTPIFHQLYHLYKFDFTKDFVIDAQNGLPLGVIKHDFHMMFSELDPQFNQKLKTLSERLRAFPFTAEMKSSRIPRNANHIGFWKAEEWQKFAFPISEVLVHDLVEEEGFAIWQCAARIVEYVYGQGRNGWTKEDAEIIHQFCLCHNVLLEERYGLQACKVIVHNLIHIKHCVQRFGSLDNY